MYTKIHIIIASNEFFPYQNTLKSMSAGVADSAPPNPVAGFKGAASGRGEGRGKGNGGEKGKLGGNSALVVGG